jgi:hypothetical protein
MKISYITCSLFNNFIYCDAGFDDKKYLRNLLSRSPVKKLNS